MSSPSRSRTRRAAVWAGFTLAWLCVLAFLPAATLRGQDAKKDAPAAAAPEKAAAPAADRRQEGPAQHAPVGDRRLGPDRHRHRPALGLLHGDGHPLLHGIPGQRGRAARPDRQAGAGDQGPQVPGRLRRLPRRQLVPRQDGPNRHRQPPQRPRRGQGGDERDVQRGHRHDGVADQLPRHHRHPRPDDRPGRAP